MSKLKVAVIGSGQVARTSHINHYKSLPDVEICAVCDVNQNAAKMAADEFHIFILVYRCGDHAEGNTAGCGQHLCAEQVSL